MSTAWNYFKNYKITEANGYPYIKYTDGDYYDFTASSTLLMTIPLFEMGINVPVYEKSEPPKSGKLKLIEPEVLASTCEKIIHLFKTDDTDISEEKLNLKNKLIKLIKGNIEESIYLLEDLKEWSEKGYFVTIDRE